MRRASFALIICLFTCHQFSWAKTPVVDTHAEAATELLLTLRMEKLMASATGVMADQLIRQNPTLAPYRDVLMQWAAGWMTWDTLGSRLVALYEAAYTEAELRELSAFYKRPVGQKSLAVMPELLRQGAELGNTEAKVHAQELDTMIRARAAELQKLDTQP